MSAFAYVSLTGENGVIEVRKQIDLARLFGTQSNLPMQICLVTVNH